MLTIWYLLTAGSMVFLVWDLYTNTPAGRVMKLAWILVVAYTGPIGLFLYLLSCRQPLHGAHDAFIATHWKQATGSLLHCVAGDATGIMISAVVVYHFGLPNGIDLIIEYISAFIVGWLVFQALFMRSMFGGSYWQAARKTFFAETVSMNMVMVGMIPTMVVLMHVLPDADNPYHALFWGVMSVATIAGMITAYPINSWMVAKGLKHGMMSAIPHPEGHKNGMSESMEGDMKSMKDTMKHDHNPAMSMDGKMDMSGGKQHDHHVAKLSTLQSAVVLIGTFGLLALSLLFTAQFVLIIFTQGG
jgi:hypothetical protein